MEYLGIILFLWILGGTGVIALWANRLAQRGDNDMLFLSADERWNRGLGSRSEQVLPSR
jgi:hypothetical protein